MTNEEILYDGYRIKYRRVMMDYSIKELAKAVRVSTNNIWLIEHGRTNPNIETCRRIAHELVCSLESLFGYVSDEPINPYYCSLKK